MDDSIVNGVTGEIYKDIRGGVTAIGGKILYVKNLKKNYKKLTQEAESLWRLRDDIKKEASRVKISPATIEWIAEVEMLGSAVNQLKTEYAEKKSKQWKLGHFWSNANYSEGLKMKRQEVLNILKEGNCQKKVLNGKLPKAVWTKNAPEIDKNSSLGEVVRKVINNLKDEQVRRIGICGRVGTGKTAIMNHLNDNEEIDRMFEMVICISVSKEWSIEKLQEAIMQRLELDAEHTRNSEKNVQTILKGLSNLKCLILLDEVWGTIDLHKVMGIHDNQNHIKVVLASRHRHICIDMQTEVHIQVEPLSPADAWNMFRKKVGDVISKRSIEPKARRVAEECQGLPLLIDRVAKSFKKKQGNLTLWELGLKRLERWDSDTVEGIEELLERLKVCYEDLKDEQKKCFLYGALYHEESPICEDYLLECWRAENLIRDAMEFKNARMVGHEILHGLLEGSFLERTEEKKYVKMNKVLRNLALKILLQNGDKYLVKPCEGLQQVPDCKECNQASKISWMDGQLHTLPEILDCGNLTTLVLQRNERLSVIPQLFFQSMRRLLVLDLQCTGIELLPSSISHLVSLKGLYLNFCKNLKKIPSQIEALKHLEVLDIRGTRLNLLQIGSLIWLKCLRISLSHYIECTEVLEIQRTEFNLNPIRRLTQWRPWVVSPPNVDMGNCTQEQSEIISKFDSLEELRIDVDSSQQLWETVGKKAIEEIANLNKLTFLQLYFPGVDCLELFVSKRQAWNSNFTFQFLVGYDDPAISQIFESLDPLHSPRYNSLKMVNGEGKDSVISEVLGQTHAFGLIDHKGVSSLSDFGNLNHILVCFLQGCNEVKTIISGGQTATHAFEELQILYVNNMPGLGSIWDGLVPVGSLGQLTTLTLIKCPELKKIFSNGMIKQLHQLQDLRVEECHQIEEIIMESENHGLEANALPKLMTLVLLDLPTLKSIWINNSLEWPSLQKIKISTCSMLKRLPFNMVNATRLRSIEGQNSWWEALEWKADDTTNQRLEPLCILN